MRSRPRDFIYTKDDLFFATVSYLHPKDRFIAFLRYVPDPNGDRQINNKKYSKVNSKEAYELLENTEYIYYHNNIKMLSVPKRKVKKILQPNEKLKKILNENPEVELLQKVIKLAEIFHDEVGLQYKYMGVSGSILPGLYDPKKSDIDFVIYGLKNHKIVREKLAEIKNKNHGLRDLDLKTWKKVYKKRIKDNTLSFKEFCWYERRKNNRGLIDGTLFDVLATRKWSEIEGKWEEIKYKQIADIKLECTVVDDIASFDTPAVYKVENTKVLKGPDVGANIDEVVSFTHTYAGQAKNGEKIVVKGKLEKMIGKEKYRAVVGTTREAIGEYIKLKTKNGT